MSKSKYIALASFEGPGVSANKGAILELSDESAKPLVKDGLLDLVGPFIETASDKTPKSTRKK